MNPPTPITDAHDLSQFECNHDELSRWLQKRALNNEGLASRTFVVCADNSSSVIGYYATAAGAINREEAPGSIKRNMPSPIPAIVLARLAVHREWEGKGIGQGLLKDAILRAVEASELIGVRAVLCHAIDVKAKAFYMKHGFLESPLQPLTVMIGLRK